LTPGVDFQQSSGFGTPQFNIAVRAFLLHQRLDHQRLFDDTPLDSRTDQMSAAGAPFPRAFDLERVEVLRGPQGTLFGASAEGGAIRFITPTPNLTEYTSYIRSEVSTTEYGAPSYEAGAAFGGPLIKDKWVFESALGTARTAAMWTWSRRPSARARSPRPRFWYGWRRGRVQRESQRGQGVSRGPEI